jgi:hypothetical protein
LWKYKDQNLIWPQKGAKSTKTKKWFNEEKWGQRLNSELEERKFKGKGERGQ